MRKIVYYVASSIDGYIAGPDDDVQGFIADGKGVEAYLAELQNFDTVIMGKNTYTFGYKYGMKPGDKPYPHMKHYIFSNTLEIDNPQDGLQVLKPSIDTIKDIKEQEGKDIYLCGGGNFAGWLLENNLIDLIKIKYSPLIFGAGTRLFDNVPKKILKTVDAKFYEDGLSVLTFEVLK